MLVAQNEVRVDWYERGADGAWTLYEAVGDGATVDLSAVETSFPVSELYVDLPDG